MPPATAGSAVVAEREAAVAGCCVTDLVAAHVESWLPQNPITSRQNLAFFIWEA